MDDILNEINQKNTQYQRAAINRAKFLLSGNEDIRGQLKELLIGIHEVMNEEKLELGGIYEIEFLESLVRIYSCGFLDESSFYSPIEGKKAFEPQQMIKREPDTELRREKMRRMVEKMQRILSVEKISRYVDEYMGEREEILATELPLSDVEDFVKIIYVRLYGQRKNMHYGVEAGEEKEVNGFRFRDFRIWRK